MAFFVVVHHRRDANQPWQNEWTDDDRLRAISTTPGIAARCRLAMRRDERIFVHRCRWKEMNPVICCSVLVKEAQHDAMLGWVGFRNPEVYTATPPVQPVRGQNCYEADPPVPSSCPSYDPRSVTRRSGT